VSDRAVLRTEFGRAGLGLVLLGTDPLRAPARVNPGPRYQAMERHFASTCNGAAGSAMMTSTASMQINLDAGPADGWAERMRLAHALGPTMMAVAANSPMLANRFSGWCSTRQRIWGALDAARCGPVSRTSSVDPCGDWARYALQAPVMLVHVPEPVPVTSRVRFSDWITGRIPLGGRRPTIADLDYHLTTLFPPVRPRRWLEIRYLDIVPDALWPAVVFMVATLLDDPRAADLATEATEPVAEAWETAARIGLADRRLYGAAVTCVHAVAGRVPDELQGSMEHLVDMVDRGRCAGDGFTERVIRHGLAETMTELAQDEIRDR
jgi:glutamate--cysteine ligase